MFPDLFWVLRPSGKRGGREEVLEMGTDHPAARCQQGPGRGSGPHCSSSAHSPRPPGADRHTGNKDEALVLPGDSSSCLEHFQSQTGFRTEEMGVWSGMLEG